MFTIKNQKMSTPNDYSISPQQVIAYRLQLDNATKNNATQAEINSFQLLYDRIVEIWKETFPNCEIPTP